MVLHCSKVRKGCPTTSSICKQGGGAEGAGGGGGWIYFSFVNSFCNFGWPRRCQTNWIHYSDVIMNSMASQITGISMVCSTVCSGADQRKHQSSASLAFVRGIHRWPVNSPHKRAVTRKMFPFDDVIVKVLWTREISAQDEFLGDIIYHNSSCTPSHIINIFSKRNIGREL